jgi:hypothetical protein
MNLLKLNVVEEGAPAKNTIQSKNNQTQVNRTKC